MANEMANLTFQKLANEAERKYPIMEISNKNFGKFLAILSSPNFQKLTNLASYQIGKKLAKNVSLEMTLIKSEKRRL